MTFLHGLELGFALGVAMVRFRGGKRGRDEQDKFSA